MPFSDPGWTVFEGAVVGACTVAVKDVPEWTVVVGNPAKPIRRRELLGEDRGSTVEAIGDDDGPRQDAAG